MTGKRRRKSVICKLLKHGSSYVMSFPHQLAKALQVKEGDEVLIKLDENQNLIVEKYTGNAENKQYIVRIRAISGAKLAGGTYKQLGFTVPSPLAIKIKDIDFAFPVIDVKEGDFFRIVFRKLIPKKAPA